MQKNKEIISSKHYAIGPLDGRYSEISKKLSPYFSEYALVKNRVKVEIYWLKFLLENVKETNITKELKKQKQLPTMM